MKLFIPIIFLVLPYSSVLGQHDDQPIQRKSIVGKFKYSNLTDFQVDSVYWDSPKNEEVFYNRYFSSQKSKRGFEEFTVYQNFEDEIMCGKSILYVIYNAKGELLSQFVLSMDSRDCGSGDEYLSKSYGKFIDDNNYELYSQWITEGPEWKETTYWVTNIKIRSDGKIEEKILKEKTVKIPVLKWVIVPTPDDTLSKKVDYRAEDGHRVTSKNALLVDNWLYDHGVAHSFQKPLPELKLNADFYLKDSDCYIVVYSERNNDGLGDKMKVVNYLLKIDAKFMDVPLNDINDLDKMDKAMQKKFTELKIEFKRK